jgi:two-component system, OmpR family, sensor kinase
MCSPRRSSGTERALTLLPKSLARRTILILLAGFALVQILGLLIHTLNQVKLGRLEEEQEFAVRAVIIYRHIALAPPEDRAALVAKEPLPKGDTATLSMGPPLDSTYPMPLAAREAVRAGIFAYGIPPGIHPHGMVLRITGMPLRYIISFGLPDDLIFQGGGAPGGAPPPPGGFGIGPPSDGPGGGAPPDGLGGGAPPDSLGGGAPPGDGGPFAGDGGPPPGDLGNLLAGIIASQEAMIPPTYWLTISSTLPPVVPWRSPGFATAFIVMTVLGAIMIIWAVRMLLVPVKTLAAAAEALGRDVANAPPLPERGPSEIVTAAVAFNTMAARVRRFVEDRTFLLTAIGHDLRTPITRLKLRAEYMEDDEQRAKMLADLDEMEAMVAATLAFGRDATSAEPVVKLDLASLLRTILDDAADGDPERADALTYTGLNHLPVRARPLALKRALANLIGNALKYGDAAAVTLHAPVRGVARIDIEDKGPGIPADEMERVFEPFRRLETSRNRETGGSGLGLSIARNILRAHGGDITLTNKPEGGLRVGVSLPV